MRYLIALGVEGGLGIQVPGLASSAFAPSVEEAKEMAQRAIALNLECYREDGRSPLPPKPVEVHLRYPALAGLLFGCVGVDVSPEKLAA